MGSLTMGKNSTSHRSTVRICGACSRSQSPSEHLPGALVSEVEKELQADAVGRRTANPRWREDYLAVRVQKANFGERLQLFLISIDRCGHD